MADMDLRRAAPRDATLSAALAADLVVVGAGWAGLASAVHATLAGLRVQLLDSAPHAGGRAREAQFDFGAGPVALDAGQHLLMGAYRECLALAAIVQDESEAPFERVGLALHDTAGLRLQAPPYPAPWHLLAALGRARGLSLRERWAAVRLVAALRARRWRTAAGATVEALLASHSQPPRVIDRLWSPLCVGALNTPPDAACAAAFAAVLRDTLGSAREASDFVLARGTLDAAVSRPATAWLRAHGASVSFGANVRALQRFDGGWRVETAAFATQAAQVVVATSAPVAARLLAPLDARAARLAAFAHEPIATVYLAWPRGTLLPLPRWILLHDDGQRAWGQWLFDRGCLGAHRVAAVVVSVGSRLDGIDRETIGDAVSRQVARQLELPMPQAQRTVIEKRATIRCTPQRPRIGCDAFADALPGLWLAGDYTDDEYPATLEAAVRSGRRAAERAAQAASVFADRAAQAASVFADRAAQAAPRIQPQAASSA